MAFDRGTAAVVLGLRYNGVGIIRSLGRVGIRVYGLADYPGLPGFKSRYCRAALSPDPVREPERLVRWLLAWARPFERPPVLFPSMDPYVDVISHFRDELAPSFRFIVPPRDVAEAGTSKRR